jgi:hypothetical protein
MSATAKVLLGGVLVLMLVFVGVLGLAFYAAGAPAFVVLLILGPVCLAFVHAVLRLSRL